VLVSVALLVIIGLVAIRGIGESAKAAAVFTIIEVIGLLIIIYIGKDAIAGYDFGNLVALDPNIGWAGVISGAFLAFYAFIGFEDMVNVSEEAKNPRRNMPLAVLISLVGATILYILVVIVATSLVSTSDLASSKAPLTLVFQAGGYSSSEIITIIGMAATVNGVVVQIIMGSRMLYGMAKQNWISPKFASISHKHQTPVFATVFVVGLMIAGVILLPLVSLASLTSLLVLGIFAIVNASLIVIKKRNHNNPGYITVPTVLPYIGVLSCLGLIGYQFLSII
jgi:amino acid transporter